MPKCRAHHMLYRPCLSVGEFDSSLPLSRLWIDPLFRGNSRRVQGMEEWLGDLRLRFERFPIPFRIVEVVMRPHEVIGREIVFSLVEPRSTSDDLLELDHRVDRAH